MKRRKVFIEGATPPVSHQITRGTIIADQSEFNQKVNKLRGGSNIIMHGSDAWPIIEKFECLNIDYLRINPENKPEGCNEIWYVDTSEPVGTNLNKVWFVCVRTLGRSLVDLFIRVPFIEIKRLPMEFSSIVSMNVRPLDKVRFSGYRHFVPEVNFCYVGDAYR